LDKHKTEQEEPKVEIPSLINKLMASKYPLDTGHISFVGTKKEEPPFVSERLEQLVPLKLLRHYHKS